METQEFKLPKLFPEKADAVKYLEESKLWVFQPGLWVSSVVEPKLKVRSQPSLSFVQQYVLHEVKL